jgi:hypothetical protein
LLAGAACVSYASYVATMWLFRDKRKLILAFMRGAKRRLQMKPS